ncbi:MAG TPA: hypothetical protein EYP33_04225 [Pyrodictium sp.]|nr:hypothetical protein [Pyrodictium sp.]
MTASTRNATMLAIAVPLLAMSVMLIFLAGIDPGAHLFKDRYRITFVIEPSALQLGGEKLGGYAEIVVSTPRGPLSKTFAVPPGQRSILYIDVPRKVIEDWEQFYRDAASKLDTVIAGKPMPTISLQLYLYDNNGSSYIGSYVVSTPRYLMQYKRMPLAKAVEEAEKDPFIAIKSEPVITINNPRILGLHKTRMPLLVEELVARTMGDRKSTPYISASPSTATASALCQPFESIWFEDLYYSASSPPNGWLQRVTNTDAACAENLWYIFATRFSKAYYYPTSSYTAYDAVSATVAVAGVTSGVYAMDDFIYRIARTSAEACISAEWIDSVTPQFVMYDTPVIGARVSYLQSKPVEVLLIFSGFSGTVYISGLTYRELIVYPQDHILSTPITGTIVDYGIYPEHGEWQGYILVPTIYYLQADGVIVQYQVSSVYVDGCEYYRVVPIVTFTPLYMQYLMDIYDARSVGMPLGSPPPSSLDELVWKPYSVQTYSGYISYAPVGQVLYEDTTAGGSIYVEAAGVSTNPIKTFTDLVLEGIFGAAGDAGTLLSTFYGILGDSVSHAEIDAGFTAIGVKISIKTFESTTDLPLTVYKSTLKDAASSSYMPLIGYYTVIVGTVSSPPGALTIQSINDNTTSLSRS